MQTNLDASSEMMLANLSRVHRMVERAQRQVSSGKRVSVASDAPDEVELLLQLRVALNRNTRVRANLERASAEADVADGAMNQAGKLLDRARSLASQAAGDSQSSETRANIAQEIAGIQEQLVAITRTQVEGRFIFGGDDDRAAPYQVDPDSQAGVTEISETRATRRIEDPSGFSFPSSLTAREIFDARNDDGTAAAGNVFAALGALRSALEKDDGAGIRSASSLVSSSSDHLNYQISFYGTLQNRIANGIEFASKYEVRLRAGMSSIEDADIAAAAVEITQGSLHIEAALAARGQAPRTTLFDVLG